MASSHHADVTRLEGSPTDPLRITTKIRECARENFVIIHIEDRFCADGFDVLAPSQAADHVVGGLPFILQSSEKVRFQALWHPER